MVAPALGAAEHGFNMTRGSVSASLLPYIQTMTAAGGTSPAGAAAGLEPHLASWLAGATELAVRVSRLLIYGRVRCGRSSPRGMSGVGGGWADWRGGRRYSWEEGGLQGEGRLYVHDFTYLLTYMRSLHTFLDGHLPCLRVRIDGWIVFVRAEIAGLDAACRWLQ